VVCRSCDERLSCKTLEKAPIVKGCLASGMIGLNAIGRRAVGARYFFQLFPIGGNGGANLCERKFFSAQLKHRSILMLNRTPRLFSVPAIYLLTATSLLAQSTGYTPLFTNSTFIKTINVNLPVGTVAGVADAANGAATYTIPIVTPPGTNGVEPQIVVGYNSVRPMLSRMRTWMFFPAISMAMDTRISWPAREKWSTTSSITRILKYT